MDSQSVNQIEALEPSGRTLPRLVIEWSRKGELGFFFFVCKEGSQQNVVDIMSSIVTKYQQQQQQQQQRESCFVELRSINQESLCSLVKRSQAFIKNCCPVIVTDHVVVVCRLSSTCPASIVIEWDDRGYSYHSTRSFL